jgi:hypothetical protein
MIEFFQKVPRSAHKRVHYPLNVVVAHYYF